MGRPSPHQSRHQQIVADLAAILGRLAGHPYPPGAWSQIARELRDIADRMDQRVAADRGNTGRPSLPREHGSERGYQQHIYRREPACPRCRKAHTATIGLQRAGVL